MLNKLIHKIRVRMSRWATWLKSRRLLQRTKQLTHKIVDLPTRVFKGDSSADKVKRGLIYRGALAGVALILTAVMLFAMTAAWYSNVIQSSGLMFEVTDWGLDGSVNIQDELTMAAPGKSGHIALSVHNSSDGIISVNLNVSKVGLYNELADMRKRLYFYIDDTTYRNGETTERVYLNSMESYAYTVLSKQNLVLGEIGNGAPLKWEWVYDVLGYYFYGTVNEAFDARVSEYLRPVVYDFDRATFRDGVLQTVDGQTTVTEFVETITKKDGYTGTASAPMTDAAGKVYYPVSVDENGYGVWIYCCTLSEIEYENMVDTRLGNADDTAKQQFETYLNVLAQQKPLTVSTVGSADQLATALADDTCNMVQLSGDMVLSQPIALSSGGEKLLDLAGHTLSIDGNSNAITLGEGASMTVMNGTIAGNDAHTTTAIKVTGGDVALSNVTMTDVGEGIRIEDEKASQNDSRFNITDCEIHCDSVGVFIKGNGATTASKTYLTIENSTIISDTYYALCGNGTATAKGNWGTDIYVHNSVLEGMYSGIYHPQCDSVLRVENSEVRGLTAFVVKGGDVTITDTKITAYSDASYADMVQQPKLDKSGYADTAAALYVETGYQYPTTVTLTGDNELTSTYQTAILKYESDNPLYVISVTGGSYSHDVSAFVPSGYVCEQKGDRYVVKKAS